MGQYKRQIGLCLGVGLGVVINLLPLEGLSPQGRLCLAFTLMTVVFWAFQIVQSGYASGLYLALLVIFQVGDPAVIFSPWTGSTMYLVIGAYLIASAVKTSGLGERIAYGFIIRFVSSYRSIICSIFILTFILSLFIPHPWPRAFLIMSVMKVIIESARIPREDAVKIGLAVFAAAVPTSMIFLTGDSVINPLAVQTAGVDVSWFQWLVYMGPPSIAAAILTCFLILMLFKPTGPVQIHKEEIKQKQFALGPLSAVEKRTIVWLVIAVALWMTDSIHGIDIGWITLVIAMLMSFPLVGEVLTAKQWTEVPVHVLLFLTAAISIGKVGAVTGMNTWIAERILPSTVPANPFILALMITVISICIHMVLGSVIAVMGIAIPALLIFTEPMGISPLVIALLVYSAIGFHYLLPFHHLNILVGQGEENGLYTQREVMHIGLPLTVVVFMITVVIEVPYWKMIGLF